MTEEELAEERWKGICSAMDDVNDLVHKAKRQVSYFTAARQLEDTLTHELQMQAAVVNYTCEDDEGVEGPVPFPHWCAGRRQDELNRARVCCRDYQVTLADQCHYFSQTGLGAFRYCFSEFPGWEPDVTVAGSGQAGCENHNSPCPASPEEADEEQNSLAAYIADKAQRNDEGSGQAFPELPPEVSDPIAEMVSGMAKTIKARVDAASDYYIGYVIARMWFPAPLLLWSTAADADKLAIGVDSNQNGIQPGHVLTSMLKRVDVAVYDAFMAAKEGKFETGINVLGLKEGGVDYAMDDNNKDLVSDDMKAAVEAAKADIIDGKVEVHDYMSDESCPY